MIRRFGHTPSSVMPETSYHFILRLYVLSIIKIFAFIYRIIATHTNNLYILYRAEVFNPVLKLRNNNCKTAAKMNIKKLEKMYYLVTGNISLQ